MLDSAITYYKQKRVRKITTKIFATLLDLLLLERKKLVVST